MCGRFSLTTQEDQIEKLFNVEVDRSMYVPRYNGAPSQNLAVITSDDPGRLSFLRWGLVPPWAPDPAMGAKMINARAETIQEKPAFRAAFRKRRCLVPADGFFEWMKAGKARQPYRFLMKDGLPFAFAGIWEEWKDGDGRPLRTFSIITTTANELMAPIHHRMPVILAPQDYSIYLQSEPMRASGLLRPFPSEPMHSYPVSSLVNSPQHNSAEVFLPAAQEPGTLF
ncbi:MAG TPA: SOS response-associated peptidase [Bacteroidales bacterium]|nr:SOS response-associated peptidase [Bacteroidales bacterium]HRZ75927.1 SOS response-associated peptidase [Bacteroidales bacterium]